jgi:hypothetical protein
MSNIMADWESAIAALLPDPGGARLLDRRAKKSAQLLRFTEKQNRTRRWVPLSAAIDWLAEFTKRGERCTPNEALALTRTAEIWNAIRGDVLFPKYQLGGDDLPWCLIKGADPDHAISRFVVHDLAAASDDPQMLRALIERLWLPRDLLLKLFQEKRWPVAPWLEQPPVRLLQEVTSNSAGKSPNKAAGRLGKRGAKQKIEWRQEVYPFMLQMLQERGDFDEPDQEEGWRAQANMERAVSDYIYDTFDKDFSESTVRDWVAKFMPELRAELASAQGR